jgi:hypothetical protein
MATFADDAAVMAVGETVEGSTRELQSAVNKVAIWTRKWRMKLNEIKSVHIHFTNKKIRQQPIFINGTKVPYANTPKYLGMILDGPPLWSSGPSSCLLTQRYRVRFPALPDFLSSSGSGAGSTRPL